MVHFALACCGLLSALPPDVPSSDDLSAYRAAAANVGRGADAHVRLALWCEAHGLEAERVKHLATAVLTDPSHVTARSLLGLIDDRGRWRKPEDIVKRFRDDKTLSETLASYQDRREKLPDTAEAHAQLASWCEQNGLEAETLVHLAAVVRLDPTREEAWKKLGARKQNGRWLMADQQTVERSEADAQRKADTHWRPLLAKWKTWLGQKTKHAEAESALAAVNDFRAVPSIWKIFATGPAADQERGVFLLRQVDAPNASRALATLAIIGSTPQVRRLASESLSGRDPREFAGPLIGLIVDPIKYEVRYVKGPGQPGELYVQGERENTRRFYSAPAPLATLRPDDVVGFDDNGLPVANRIVGWQTVSANAAVNPLLSGAPDLTGAGNVLGNTVLGSAGQRLGQTMLQNQRQAAGLPIMPGGMLAKPANQPLVAQVPVGRLMVQAQQQAEFSRQRLQEDVAALDRHNKEVNELNERVVSCLRMALTENLAADRETWVKWWTALAETVSSAAPRPQEQEADNDKEAAEKPARAPSFGVGTYVWTLAGLRPIEDLRAGDKVLSQEAVSGALSFTPALTTRRLGRVSVKAIRLGNAALVATDLERLWVAGKGWVTTGNLRPGDSLRTLSGVVRVTAVEEGGFQSAFHVQVEKGRGILVGARGILAHDDRIALPVATPFDRSEE